MKLMNDPDVLTDARKKGLDPNPVSGDDLESLGKELLAQPPEVIQQMKKSLRSRSSENRKSETGQSCFGYR